MTGSYWFASIVLTPPLLCKWRIITVLDSDSMGIITNDGGTVTGTLKARVKERACNGLGG